MKVLIVDDEPLARARLARLIAKLRPDFSILPQAEDGPTALALCRGMVPDLALLDIEMPGMSGIELARQLKLFSPPPAIIFITAYPDKALTAFSVQPQGYLVKPISEGDLDKLLTSLRIEHRAHAALKQQEAISYLEHGVEKTILLSDVRLIRTEDKYLRVYTQQGGSLIDGSLKQLLASYSKHLLRVHRNTLINQAYIDDIGLDGSKHWVKVLDYQSKIEVSRREWSRLKLAFKNH